MQAANTPRARILARPEDVHCVVFHVFVLLGYAVAFCAIDPRCDTRGDGDRS